MNTRNRRYNVTNPHQGKDRKVLVVCSAGLMRSPTVANVLRDTYKYNTRAVGYSTEYALIILDEVMLEWADEVIFVHQDIANFVKTAFGYTDGYLMADKMTLNLPDIYDYMDKQLQDIILQQYEDACIERGVKRHD